MSRSGAAVGALALLGVVGGSGCKGKGATGGCGDEDSLCGGSPVGTWEVTDSCSFPVVSRPAQNYDTTLLVRQGVDQAKQSSAPLHFFDLDRTYRCGIDLPRLVGDLPA